MNWDMGTVRTGLVVWLGLREINYSFNYMQGFFFVFVLIVCT